MVLRELHDLYDRLASDPEYAVAPRGFSYQRVSFVIVLEPDGSLHAIEDARTLVGGRSRPRLVLVPGGAKKTGPGLNPCFLWDNPAYLLGYDPRNPQRAARAFEAFRERHLELENGMALPGYFAVCRFLEGWEPADAYHHPVLVEIGAGFGVFQVRGQARYVHEHRELIEGWEADLDAVDVAPEGQCIVTGEFAPLARLHPAIKGVAGAQPTGAVIVGFNLAAFESYGKTQSFNAPVSNRAAERYTTALNGLLDGPRRDKHRLVVGDCTVVFWTDRPSTTEDIFLRFAEEGSSAMADGRAQDQGLRLKLEVFLAALRKGEAAYGDLEASPQTTSYSILGLAPNAARIVVRFFHKGTIRELLDNLRRHYSDMGIERQWGDGSRNPDPEFPPAALLLRQTARERKDVPPVLAGALLQSIVGGGRYPTALYQAVMRRITADRVINYARVCVIKGYVVRNLGKEVPMSLDGSRMEPGYRLGRLFAVLEKTQADALGGRLNATVRDRFYSSASAAPAAVFPRLLRTYQHHLAKLETGRKVARERSVQEILEPVERFPAHLNLAEQGLFALGYYHQMNDLFRSKDERASGA